MAIDRNYEQASLALLASAWDDPNVRDRVRRVITGAQGKLPVIATGVLAIVAMYGMYLMRTGGVRETEHVVERTPNGDFRESTRTSYWGPARPLRAVVDLLVPGAGKAG